MPVPALKKQRLDQSDGPASASRGTELPKKKVTLKSKKIQVQTNPPQGKKTTTASGNSSSEDESQHDSESYDDDSGSDAEDEYDLDVMSSEDEKKHGDEPDPDSLDGLELRKPNKKRKRNDPDAFSTSMAKILSSHLTTTARKDPILVRSKKAAQQIDDSRLEAKARRLLALKHKEALEKGRIKDVIPQGDADGEKVKAAMEKEKALRKLAQRGVIKLFNAVRAAQTTGAQAMQEAKSKGVVGIEARDKQVTEISKQGFLDLIRSSSTSKA